MARHSRKFTGISQQGEKHGEPSWRIRIYEKDEKTGEKKRVSYTYIGPLEEATEYRQMLLIKQNRGVNLLKGKQLFEEHLNYWLKINVEPTTKFRTHDSYRRIAEGHIIPALGKYCLEDINSELIEEFYLNILNNPNAIGGRADGKDEPLSGSTIHRINTVMSLSLRKAFKQKKIDHIPTDYVDLPKEINKTKIHWNPEQVRYFLENAKDCKLYALWRLITFTGMRIGEALAIRLKDCKFNGELGYIEIKQSLSKGGRNPIFEKPKTKKGDRTVLIDEKTTRVIRKYFDYQEQRTERKTKKWQEFGLLFSTSVGTPYSYRNVERDYWSPLMERLSIPKLGIHGLRHTHATLMNQLGIPLTEVGGRLGHAKLESTLNYLHVDPLKELPAVVAFSRYIEGE